MVKLCVVVSILISSVAVSSGQNVQFGGNCPPVQPMSNLDIKQFSGKWYEVRRFPTILDPTGRCATHSISPEFFWNKFEYKRVESFTGLALANSFIFVNAPFAPNGAFFGILPVSAVPLPFPYDVYETDYNTYALTGNCINLGLMTIRFTWVLGRNISMTGNQAFITTMNTKLQAKNITIGGMINTEHYGCPAGY